MPSALDSQPHVAYVPVLPVMGAMIQEPQTETAAVATAPVQRPKPSVAVTSHTYGKRSLKIGDVVWFWPYASQAVPPKPGLIITILDSGNLFLTVFDAGTSLTEIGDPRHMSGVEQTDPKATWMQRIGKWSFRD